MVNTADEAATFAATQAASMQRIEIVSDRRRAHDPAFRALVVANSYLPGTRIRELAARHGICRSLVYRWRRERAVAAVVKTGSALRLVPVQLVDEPRAAEKQPNQPHRTTAPAPAPAPTPTPTPTPTPEVSAKSAVIEIEFPGGVRVRVDETINQAALRRVVAVLRR